MTRKTFLVGSTEERRRDAVLPPEPTGVVRPEPHLASAWRLAPAAWRSSLWLRLRCETSPDLQTRISPPGSAQTGCSAHRTHKHVQSNMMRDAFWYKSFLFVEILLSHILNIMFHSNYVSKLKQTL